MLWDTLLEPPFERDEVRVVIAHEYGHHESQHIWKGLAWYGLLSLPILFVVARVARRWGGLYRPRAVPVALLALVGGEPRRAAVRQPAHAADGDGGGLDRARDHARSGRRA